MALRDHTERPYQPKENKEKMTSYDLKGQTAIVTGGGQGIGRAIVLRLAREGVNVVVADIVEENAASVAREVASFGVGAIHLRIDVAQESQVEAMAADTAAKFGRLDIMCANAGIAEFKPFIETDEATWDRLFAVNAKGVFFCDKHAARQMIKQGGSGRIINTSSIVGKVAVGPGVPLGAYTASKHAVIGITRSFALELAPHNVLVHCICPSAIETAQFDQTDREVTAMEGSPVGSYKERVIRARPLSRPLWPEEVANVVAFLCSPDYSGETGQAFNITGGVITH